MTRGDLLLDSFNAPNKVCSCKCSFSCSPQLDHLSRIRKCVLRWEVTHVVLLVVDWPLKLTWLLKETNCESTSCVSIWHSPPSLWNSQCWTSYSQMQSLQALIVVAFTTLNVASLNCCDTLPYDSTQELELATRIVSMKSNTENFNTYECYHTLCGKET